MKPTKKTAAKRVAKKKPAKRAVRTGSIEHKLMRLKNRINDAYRNRNDMNTIHDKSWVIKLISDVRNNNLTKLCKEDFEKCNGLWRAYA